MNWSKREKPIRKIMMHNVFFESFWQSICSIFKWENTNLEKKVQHLSKATSVYMNNDQ